MSNPPTTTEPLHLLHLEDDAADAELIHARINGEWPHCRIDWVRDRAGFAASLQHGRIDVILSDFTLPGFDGMAALRLAREHRPGVPFIFLSGTIGEDHAVEALQLGATDYVIKARMGRLSPAIRRALGEVREQGRRQHAERRLQEQAGLLDKARDAICVIDLEHRLTYLNQSAERLFGLTRGEAVGRPLAQLMVLTGSTSSFERVRQILESDGAWTGEMGLVAKTGQAQVIESRWTLVRDVTGRPQSVLLINTDITEQKKLEQQILRSQRIESIGTLAGGIAHDLNNALTPILMSVELLRESFADDRSSRLLDVLAGSAQHGAGLVRQVLEFASGAEGRRTEVQLRFVIREVVQLMRGTLPKAIAIDAEVPDGLWPLQGDTTQLSQILINLCVNARDAMPNGGRLTIEAQNVVLDEYRGRTLPGASSGRHVLVTVADTGCGISPLIIDRIFDPFFTTKAQGKGTGLGLSTVLGLVKGHSGFLEVDTAVGAGTKFRLYFPALVAQPAPPHDPTSPAPCRPHGETLLVIDDEESVRNVMRALLVADGHKVLLAADGAAGLATYRAHGAEIALVITDLMMPGMQGAEVIAELRRQNPAVRILAVSGMQDPKKIGVLTESGRTEFLPKPLTRDQLRLALNRMLTGATPDAGRNESEQPRR